MAYANPPIPPVRQGPGSGSTAAPAAVRLSPLLSEAGGPTFYCVVDCLAFRIVGLCEGDRGCAKYFAGGGRDSAAADEIGILLVPGFKTAIQAIDLAEAQPGKPGGGLLAGVAVVAAHQQRLLAVSGRDELLDVIVIQPQGAADMAGEVTLRVTDIHYAGVGLEHLGGRIGRDALESVHGGAPSG